MSGWHPASAGSDEFLRFFLLALLIIVATVFEIISHSITHKLQHEAHDHSGHDDGHEVKPNIFKAQLSLKLWTRAQSELTVLGFLACCIWFANRAQLLEVGVGWGSTLFMGESAGVPAAEHGHHLRFLEAAHHEDPAAHHDDDFAAHGPVWTMDGYCWPGSLRWLPPSGEALVHILEDVHMTLFLTMVAYFFCMQLSLNLLVGTLERFQKEERLMSDASSAAPSPPASPTALMIESIRTRLVGFYLGDEDLDGQVDEAELEHRLKMLTKEQADLVREIHKTVTVTTVVTIDKPDACAKPSPKASSPGAVAGGGVRFNVSSFLMQLMREDVEELIQFDTSAWSVVMSYSVTLACTRSHIRARPHRPRVCRRAKRYPASLRRLQVLCLGLARVSCFSDTSALAVGFGIDLIWLTASLYAAARVAVHAARLARPVGVHGCCGQQLWPAIGLDRLCFPLQFGVVGSFPWRAGAHSFLHPTIDSASPPPLHHSPSLHSSLTLRPCTAPSPCLYVAPALGQASPRRPRSTASRPCSSSNSTPSPSRPSCSPSELPTPRRTTCSSRATFPGATAWSSSCPSRPPSSASGPPSSCRA